VPVADKYQPEWVLISAGFDPHDRDPLAGMAVTENGFGAMASMLLDVAERHAGGKIAFLLEGGYDLKALKNSVACVFQEMKKVGERPMPVNAGGETIQPLIRTVLQVQERYW
ncbi:MAG: histone deacetylase, partial [Deltaproteobacteria bacterium]